MSAILPRILVRSEPVVVKIGLQSSLMPLPSTLV